MEELLSGKEASQSLGLQGQLLSGLHSNSYVSIGEEKEFTETGSVLVLSLEEIHILIEHPKTGLASESTCL